MLKIGITGGIGVGKTTVTKIFSLLGVPIYDADTRAKWLQNNDLGIIGKIKTEFGTQSYSENGYDFKYMRSIVFNDKTKLDLLNSIIHPKILEDSNAWYNRHLHHKYVIKEAALMLESDSYKYLDKLIVVTSPLDLRVNRIKQRDVFRTQKEIEMIISKQMPEHLKIAKADFVIENDEKQLLINQVLMLNEIFSS